MFEGGLLLGYIYAHKGTLHISGARGVVVARVSPTQVVAAHAVRKDEVVGSTPTGR